MGVSCRRSADGEGANGCRLGRGDRPADIPYWRPLSTNATPQRSRRRYLGLGTRAGLEDLQKAQGAGHYSLLGLRRLGIVGSDAVAAGGS